MEIRRTRAGKFFFALTAIFLLTFFTASSTYAASGSILVIPNTGTHTSGSIISASVKIDGGGTLFNAAKATVTLNPKVEINNLTLGDCGFSFIKTPTVSDPSFVGVILGGSSSSCTVYTMTFQASVPGTQLVTLTDSSIKSFQGAQEIWSTSQNGSFVINAISQQSSVASLPEISPTAGPAQAGGVKFYSVTYTVPLPANANQADVNVKLDSLSPDDVTVLPPSATDAGPVLQVTFKKVPEGVHTLTATYKDKKLAEQIVNVSGDNGNLTFGSSAKKPSYLWVFYAIGIAVLAGVVVGAVILFRRFKNRNSGISNSVPN